jgi:hypothetical protein
MNAPPKSNLLKALEKQVKKIVQLTKIDISNPKLNPTKQRVNLQTRRKKLWKLCLNLPISEQKMAEQLIINKVRKANELIELIEDRDEQLEVQQRQHDEQPRQPTQLPRQPTQLPRQPTQLPNRRIQLPRQPTQLPNRRIQLPRKHEQQLRQYAEHGQKRRRDAQQKRRDTELELNVAFGALDIK